METIIGVNYDKLSFEQNEEGMFDIMIKHNNNNYRTGFVYDSINLLNQYQLRVSQTDSNGNKKYGLIVVCLRELVFPCIFDSIKPYKNLVVKAFIGDEEFYITHQGEVYNSDFWKIYHKE